MSKEPELFYIDEWLAHDILDTFETFLDDRHVNIENPEKQEAIDDGEDPDTIAIIFGSDYGYLFDAILRALSDYEYNKNKELLEFQKTGEWIDESVVTGTTSGEITHIRQYRCSVCGGLFGRKTDNYCYNCGAKMERR